MAEQRLIDAKDIQGKIENRLSIFAKRQNESFPQEAGLAIGILLGIKELFKAQPTIEAKPVVHAHWIRKNNEMKCSNCKFIYYSNHDDFNFCPNCGAQMDEERSGKDGN